jgi:hypothetical protein
VCTICKCYWKIPFSPGGGGWKYQPLSFGEKQEKTKKGKISKKKRKIMGKIHLKRVNLYAP